MKKIKDYIFWILAGIAIIIYLISVSGGDTKTTVKKNLNLQGLDAFAQCLSDNGAKFFGASWCSYCNQQKEMFASSVKYLPYVECALPTGGQTAECEANNIQGYPTWKFADNSQQSGVMSFEQLALKTGCELPLN